MPNNYPLERITFDNVDSNFPRIFKTWFFEQTKEIARRCVEPPLKPKPKDPPFEPRPSIGPAIGKKHALENISHNFCYIKLHLLKQSNYDYLD